MSILEPCFELGDLPEYVKVAEVDSFDATKHDAHVFADPPRRELPCHTKAAAFASAVAFYRNRERYSGRDAARIESKLLKSADFWLISRDVARVREKLAGAVPVTPDEKYAYIRIYDDGRKERRMPLRTPKETQQAAEYFRKYARQLGDYEGRVKIATRILEAASDQGAALTVTQKQDLESFAGWGECSYKQAAQYVDQRVIRVSNAAAIELRKLAAALRSRPENELSKNASLREVAEVLDHVDRAAGLTGKYGSDLAPPEALFTETYTKQAASTDAVTLPTGRVYRRDDLSKLALAELESAFGPWVVDDFRAGDGVDAGKMAAFVETLPLPDAEMLEGLLRKAGAAPLDDTLTKVDFSKAASLY